MQGLLYTLTLNLNVTPTYACPAPCRYIMTTAAAQSSIVECLQANAYFGLVPNQVHVFAPDLSVPLLTEDGKMAMETPFRVARTQGSSGERV